MRASWLLLAIPGQWKGSTALPRRGEEDGQVDACGWDKSRARGPAPQGEDGAGRNSARSYSQRPGLKGSSEPGARGRGAGSWGEGQGAGRRAGEGGGASAEVQTGGAAGRFLGSTFPWARRGERRA